MSQKKMKLIKRYLKFKKLDQMVIADGNHYKNMVKEVKRFFYSLNKDHKASFSNSLKEDYATSLRTHS
jgi:hypothetical protein